MLPLPPAAQPPTPNPPSNPATAQPFYAALLLLTRRAQPETHQLCPFPFLSLLTLPPLLCPSRSAPPLKPTPLLLLLLVLTSRPPPPRLSPKQWTAPPAPPARPQPVRGRRAAPCRHWRRQWTPPAAANRERAESAALSGPATTCFRVPRLPPPLPVYTRSVHPRPASCPKLAPVLSPSFLPISTRLAYWSHAELPSRGPSSRYPNAHEAQLPPFPRQ